ncbi:hypothetical protein L798_13541 [Zootermopsis nevadensis]|uniref:Uncharacterized protein n=1 Tax=Zootermopsis nevadensis TaxID=136037 RepID=A0A067R3U4_ZOONE|nr:hypothetical protein L798_13541 [Zootermopsis nevadensis]
MFMSGKQAKLEYHLYSAEDVGLSVRSVVHQYTKRNVTLCVKCETRVKGVSRRVAAHNKAMAVSSPPTRHQLKQAMQIVEDNWQFRWTTRMKVSDHLQTTFWRPLLYSIINSFVSEVQQYRYNYRACVPKYNMAKLCEKC